MTAVYAAHYRSIWIGLLLIFGFLPSVFAVVVQVDAGVQAIMNSGDGELEQPARYIIGMGTSVSVNRSSESIQIGVTNSYIDLTVQKASVFRTGVAYVGYGAATSNSATVTGTGTHWESVSGFYVGYNGRNGSLRISNGGRVTFASETQADFVVGYNAVSSTNTVVVTGSGSILLGDSGLHIGNSGSFNSLRIEEAGVVESTIFGVGSGSGNNNSVVVTGSGSLLRGNNSQKSYVGGKGAENTLSVEAGGKVDLEGDFIVGDGTSFVTSDRNSVLITGEGSSMESSGELIVGAYGSHNLFTVSDQGSVSTASSRIGVVGNQNEVTITGLNSVWSNSGSLVIGGEGSENAVTVADGALLMLDGPLILDQSSGSGNQLRLDRGFFAWVGDQTEAVEALLENESILVWNGSSWENAVDGSNFVSYYFLTDEEAFAFTGYQDLAGYTILTSYSAAVPEPGTWVLMIGAMAVGALFRKNRRVG